ncbi:MAG: dihydroxy-acid dehydratase [bacterium]
MPHPNLLRRTHNPYRDNVQGKANEPITVLALLKSAECELNLSIENATQMEIVRRLDDGFPRIAIIGGSADHPAHIVDRATTLMAAASLWQRGAVPFAFSIPVLCDGTAQSNLGMCYSLQSRNLVSAMVVNQMEAHSYHGAFVIQGCDKTPFAVCSGLAHLDVLRRRRGEAPLHATFAPAHVLRGGTMPDDLKSDLLDVANRARKRGHPEIGGEIEEVMRHILQCASNQAFQGVLIRAREHRILTAKRHKDIECRLAANTCHADGGICAFNGTGNSCRLATSAMGLVHPALELLAEPPTFDQIDKAVDALMNLIDRDEASVSRLVINGFRNAVCVHTAAGGSTNLTLHLVAARTFAGIRTTLDDYEAIGRKHKIPDIFNYSLTDGRDIFALAQQVERGESMGVATILYELNRLGIPVNLDTITMAGTTWAKRIGKGTRASAARIKENPIILDRPKRPKAGIDQLHGNLFDSAVVKIAGMPDEQIDMFDDVVSIVWYFQNEDEATKSLLTADIINELAICRSLSVADLRRIHDVNRRGIALPKRGGKRMLLEAMARTRSLRVVVVIAGQGPKAFGMPEMFTPMHHVNSSSILRRMAMIVSDGRYSGVTYGAAVGHVCPEAYDRGPIAALQTGDLLWVRLRKKRIDVLDRSGFREGHRRTAPLSWHRKLERQRLIGRRQKHMAQRRMLIAPLNRMDDVTDAAHGVVPESVWKAADPR